MSRRTRPWIFLLTTVLCFVPTAMASDAVDASVRQIQKACLPHRDGSHLPRLAALRQLGDPTLRALFERLLDHADWQVQVHAVLVLAELRTPQRLSVEQVLRVDPIAQEAIIANAIDFELLGAEQIEEFLEVGSLEPMATMMLMAERILAGESVEIDSLREWATDPDLRHAAMASCLLALLGDTGPLITFSNRLSGLSPAQYTQNLLLVLEMIRQYEIRLAADWVARLIEQDDLHYEVEYRAILTLLTLDPDTGLQHWRRRLGVQPNHRDSIRYGLLLLASGVPAASTEFDRLQESDELVETIVRIGQSDEPSETRTLAMIDLLELGHRRSTEWLMSTLSELDDEAATRICLYLIDRLAQNRHDRHTALAIQATTDLVEIDASQIESLLRQAEDDSIQQQAILLGLFQTDREFAGRAAASIKRIGFSRADSLALILMAKHDLELQPGDLETLGMIASGGGNLSEAMQTQAGWLYLKHAGKLDDALSRIFAEMEP